MTTYSPDDFLKKLFPFSKSDLVYVSEQINKLNLDIETFKGILYSKFDYEQNTSYAYYLEDALLITVNNEILEQYSHYFEDESDNYLAEEIKIINTEDNVFYGIRSGSKKEDVLEFYEKMKTSYNKIPVNERTPVLLWFWKRYSDDVNANLKYIEEKKLLKADIKKPNLPATEQQIKTFESKFNIILPESYKAFLLENNGGEGITNVYLYNSTDENGNEESVYCPINKFLSLEEIETNLLDLPDGMKPDLMVIASEYQTETSMGIKEDNLGKIYMAYSFELDESPELISDNFELFINSFIDRKYLI